MSWCAGILAKRKNKPVMSFDDSRKAARQGGWRARRGYELEDKGCYAHNVLVSMKVPRGHCLYERIYSTLTDGIDLTTIKKTDLLLHLGLARSLMQAEMQLSVDDILSIYILSEKASQLDTILDDQALAARGDQPSGTSAGKDSAQGQGGEAGRADNGPADAISDLSPFPIPAVKREAPEDEETAWARKRPRLSSSPLSVPDKGMAPPATRKTSLPTAWTSKGWAPEPSYGAGQTETPECSLMPASDVRMGVGTSGSGNSLVRSAPGRDEEHTTLEPQSSFSTGDEELVEISAEEFMGTRG